MKTPANVESERLNVRIPSTAVESIVRHVEPSSPSQQIDTGGYGTQETDAGLRDKIKSRPLVRYHTGGVREPTATLDEDHRLALDTWHTLTFDWDLGARTCTLSSDDWRVDVPLQHTARNGICYLRLRSTSESIDHAGYLVDEVQAKVD